jgi:hypothetical protein
MESVVACKGVVFLSARRFVEQRYGSDAVERCLAELSPDDRSQLSSVVAVGWYPIDLVLRFHRVVDRLHGRGDLGLCVDMGRFGAEWQLTRFHKLFLRFTSPAWLYHKGAQLHSHYFDAGRWEITQSGDHALLARRHDFDCNDEALCRRQIGWFTRAAELTGAKKSIVTERVCRTRGASYCEFLSEWT